MTTLDKAILRWGFEDFRTIGISVLEENGCSPEFMEELFKTLTESEEEEDEEQAAAAATAGLGALFG
ncbi:MAG: hypothetical protein J6Q86_02680 [Methanobrevibacter sp.]|nr:hypothetical protein [Methanobrevibacter sp.]